VVASSGLNGSGGVGQPPLKVCFVGTPWLAVGPRRGGIPKTILELARILSREHEVHIVSAAPATNDIVAGTDRLHFHYAKVREVPEYPIAEKLAFDSTGLGLLGRMVFAILVIFAEYAKLRRIHRFDVTLLTNKFVALPILVSSKMRRHEVFVYSEQNIWPWMYSRPVALFARLRYVTNVGLGRLVCRMSDAVHANSDSIRDGILRHGGGGAPIVPIPNGVDRELLAEDIANLGEPLLVAFVGRLVEDKGVLILDDVIRKMAASDKQIRFVVFGDGPLRERLSDLEGRRCTLMGSRSREEVLEALRTVAVILFLSPVENVPSLALLEALALGKAVIATNVGDTGRFLSDGQNALLCDPNPEAVVRAIQAIVNDQPLYERLTSRARALAAENSWEHVGQRHVTLFRSLIRAERT